MRCPNCGTLMNRHAEKPMKQAEAPEGEILVSIHCCPGCGKVETEKNPPTPSSYRE